MGNSSTWRYPRANPKERSGALVAGLSLVTFGIYLAYWVYRLHAETPSRVGKDPATPLPVILPFAVAGVSLVPIVASGVFGSGDVQLWLFWGGMAINFAAHVLYLMLSWKLSDRLAEVAAADRLRVPILSSGKQNLVLGMTSIALENIGMKSLSLLSIETPSWFEQVDMVLLILGISGLWNWGRQCLVVANSFAANEERVYSALGLDE
ncbi:DUF4234 domain-containing protein [Saltatorellus ferox]